jgi:3-oxoacyl-[acyl-carrier protein] reductase
VADYRQAQSLIKHAQDTFESLEILINNAGVTRDNLIMLLNEQDWDFVLDTNLKSTFIARKQQFAT